MTLTGQVNIRTPATVAARDSPPLGLRQLPSLSLCVVECSGEQQCKWLSNGAAMYKGFDKLLAFKERFITLNFSLFFCYKYRRVLTKNNLNIAIETNFILFRIECV
jgi:hypothetical protein